MCLLFIKKLSIINTENSEEADMDRKGVAEKWYKKIGFPVEYDGEFYAK